MKTRIIAVIGLVLAAGALFFLNERRAKKDTVTKETALEASWNVFQSYLEAAKNHDLETLSSLSHQLSSTCKDPSKRPECDELMDSVYAFGSLVQKENITTVAYDARQILLASDNAENLGGPAPSINRFVIYFTRSGDQIKFLSFDPFRGAFIIRDDTIATSTIQARLREMTKDTDGDAISDEEENCIGTNVSKDCVKTDPNKKDTDRDGWWDSTEALFYR